MSKNWLQGVDWVAFRGASSMAPENSLPAIEIAKHLNVDWIHCDVRLTKDLVPVLAADSTLSRATGFTQNDAISSIYSRDLTSIEIGSPFSTYFTGTHVPTLEQALSAAKNSRFILELKQSHINNKTLVKAVLERLSIPKNQVILASYEEEVIKAIDLDGTYPMMGIAGTLKDVKKWLRYDMKHIAIHPGTIDPRVMEQVLHQERRVFAYGTDKQEDLFKLINWGVDGFFTAKAHSLRLKVENAFGEISPMELNEWMKNNHVTLVDVRELEEFEEEHLPNAIHMPATSFTPYHLTPQPNQPLVFYCQVGVKSAWAAKEFLSARCDCPAYHLKGGLRSWKEYNYPIFR